MFPVFKHDNLGFFAYLKSYDSCKCVYAPVYRSCTCILLKNILSEASIEDHILGDFEQAQSQSRPWGRVDSVIELRTPEREVQGSNLTTAVQCP